MAIVRSQHTGQIVCKEHEPTSSPADVPNAAGPLLLPGFALSAATPLLLPGVAASFPPDQRGTAFAAASPVVPEDAVHLLPGPALCGGAPPPPWAPPLFFWHPSH